jgi:hypothetical protein
MTDYCNWGRHRVYRGIVGWLHGISACSECREEHNRICCDLCASLGFCPRHGRDLAACKAEAAARDLEAEWRAQ